MKTRDQVREEFDRQGLSISEWARKHRVSRSTTYQVLRGDKKGRRGESHKVAVLLGLKAGVIS